MARTNAPKTTADKSAKTVEPRAGKAAAGKSPAVKGRASKAVETVKPASDKKRQAAPEPREKVRKPKLVRDSFTMPEAEYAALGEMKKACLKAGIEVKKSELLRIGVALLRQLDTAGLKRILDGLPALKAGRPKKGK